MVTNNSIKWLPNQAIEEHKISLIVQAHVVSSEELILCVINRGEESHLVAGMKGAANQPIPCSHVTF